MSQRKTKHSIVSDNPRLPYLVVKPFTDEDWLYERRFGVGASKCGITVGCKMYKSDTAYNLWRSILGLDKPLEMTWAMEKGHILEDFVAREFEKEFGYKICKTVQGASNGSNWIAVDKKNPYLRVSPDRLFYTGHTNKINERGVLEIKSSSKMFYPEDLADPKKCLMWFCQVQYNLHVLGLPFGYLGFIHDDGPRGGERWFQRIDYKKDFCEKTLIPAITQLWKENIYPCKDILELNKIEDATTIEPTLLAQLHDYAPAVSSSDDVAIRYPYQEDGKSVEGDDFVLACERYKELKSQVNALKEEMEEIETRLKVAMLDAEFMMVGGKPIATYKTNKSSQKLSTELVKEKYPDIYTECLVTTPGARVFKIK